MTRKVYIYFALVFLLGIIAGGSGIYYFGWYTGHWHRGFDRGRVVARLKKELNLSDHQVQQLAAIIDEGGRKYQDLQRRTAPQFDAVRQETRDKVGQILDPEQRTKFEALVRRWDATRRPRRN